MSGKVRFISDLHFNHRNMATRRGFNSVEAMNQHIIESFNKVVKKKDSTYILGDITMESKKGQELLEHLNGYIFVVLGNHDRRQDIPNLMKYVDGIAGMVDFKRYKVIATHCPIQENELNYRFKYNIHGHVHENSITKVEWDYLSDMDREVLDKRYLNVSCEVIDYTPKTFEELKEFYNIYE